MKCTLRNLESSCWLLEGVIDFRSVIELRAAGEAVLREVGGDVCFDFSGVRQANTAALTLMLCWRRLASELGGKVSFRELPQALLSIAAVSDLESLLD